MFGSNVFVQSQETHWVFKSKYLKKLLGYNGRRLKRIAKVSKTAITHVGSISEEFEVGYDEELFSITGSEEVIATGLTMMEQAIPEETSTTSSNVDMFVTGSAEETPQPEVSTLESLPSNHFFIDSILLC